MTLQFNNVWNSLRGRWGRVPPTKDTIAWSTAAAPMEEPRRVGVVFGGGGGKGCAHIGVLATLESLQMPIDLMVGTSAGGAVALLYAAGISLDQIEQVFRENALRRIATPDPARTGLVGSRKREALITRLLGDRSFDDLRIPCAVVTVDLISGNEVIINEGSLATAILATTALPGIFPPVVRGEQMLVDGGVRNNLPVDVAEQLGAQRVIAVDLSDAPPDFSLSTEIPNNPLARLTLAPRQLAIANRALALLIDQVNAMRLAKYPPAVHLRPGVGHIDMLDMSRTEEGRQAGEVAAAAALDELIALRDWRLALPPEPEAAAPRPPAFTFALPAWRWPGAPFRQEGP